MQIKVEIFADEKGQSHLPMELSRMNDAILQNMAVIMRSFSIGHIELKVSQAGLLPATELGFKPLLDEALPEPLKLVRSDIVRGILRTYMERFGVRSVDIVLSEAELTELRTYWKFLSTGNNKLIEEMKFHDLPLTYDTDPAKGSVIPEQVSHGINTPTGSGLSDGPDVTTPETPPPT